MDLIPALAILLSAASAALFILVGRTVQRRDVSHEARSAQMAFVTWWYGLAAVTVVAAVQALPGFPLNLDLFIAMTAVLLLVLCAALAGLMHYLIFLYTSRRNLLPFLVVGYGAYFVVLLVYILQNGPTAVTATRWGPELEFSTPITSGPLYWTVLILLIGPPVASAAAYLSLYRLAQDPILKRRILLVSLSIIVWFSSSLVGTAAGAEDADWWRMSSRLIALAAASVVLYAYTGLRPATPETAPQGKEDTSESLYEAPKREVASVQPLVALI